MKRLITICLLLAALPVAAVDIGAMPNPSYYNPDLGAADVNVRGYCKAMTADGVIAADAGAMVSIYITAAEANDDFIIYDNASAASGTVIFNATNVAAGDKSYPNVPAIFANGAYLDVTAADASAAFTVTVCWNN